MEYEAPQRFKDYAAKLNETSDLQIAFKDESLFMRLLGKLLFFNKKFMTNFTTTIGSTIYFPSREHLLVTPEGSLLNTLAHEYVHIRDAKKYGLKFSLMYLFPLSMLVCVPVLFVLGFWFTALCLAGLSVTPIPAYWRKNFELRAYIMNFIAYNEIWSKKNVPAKHRLAHFDEMIEKTNSHFTGPNYYFMWPFGVKAELTKAVEEIKSGDILKRDDIYMDAIKALRSIL